MTEADKVLQYFSLLDRIKACGFELVVQGNTFQIETASRTIHCHTIEQLQYVVMGMEAE